MLTSCPRQAAAVRPQRKRDAVACIRGHTTEKTRSMLELLKDLWGFMRERKKFWLAPIILVLLLLGALMVLAQGSAVAPFIYTLF
ncbi:hypothetical protein CKO31_00260 [Thiohalocapsa halophila]|uniref:ABC transporter ATP-binding protein n=2 Tax=Thiohalocapsa halophila TaxID=69359 RepID=A0ABS1CCJ0_9GAMM|nr:hypothetical protein [Thiohalocapsa halophila]